MEIPNTPKCQMWAAALGKPDASAGTTDGQQILANIEADPCVPGKAQKVFFEGIESGWGSKMDSWEEAKDLASKVVQNSKDRLALQGNPVSDNRFAWIYTIKNQKSVKYLVGGGNPQQSKFLECLGHTDAELGDLNDDELKEALKSAWERWSGPKRLGNLFDIVWVADEEEVRQIAMEHLPTCLDRMGMEDMNGENLTKSRGKPWIGYRYQRNVVEGHLHVPRVLDAIYHAPFRPTSDCNAESGLTHPRTRPAEKGTSEAVHKTIILKKEDFQYDILPNE